MHVILLTLIKITGSGYVQMTHPTFQLVQYLVALMLLLLMKLLTRSNISYNPAFFRSASVKNK
jgi:hypothetical protein